MARLQAIASNVGFQHHRPLEDHSRLGDDEARLPLTHLPAGIGRIGTRDSVSGAETFYDGQAGMYWTVGTPDRFTEEATHLTLPPMMVLEHRFTVNWICHLPLFN